MNKLMITLLCLSIVSGLNATNKKNDIIPGASYVILENADNAGSWGPSRYSEYYTFDGKLIKRVGHEMKFIEYSSARERLDPKAPKPRPAKFKIIYDNGYLFVRSGVYWIVFYDIHGNRIYTIRYFGSKNPTKNYIASMTTRVYKICSNGFAAIPLTYIEKRLDQIFDLSIVTQEIEQPWYKVW